MGRTTKKKQTPRSRARANNVRRRRRNWLLVRTLLAVGLVAGLGYAFYSYMVESPRFNVKRVRVEGARMLREEHVLAVAGITRAHNLLGFRPEQVATRVARMPYVRDCEVRRAYPDMVVIRIEEREPAATVLIDQRAFEIDLSGVVLRELAPLAEPTGPMITGVPELVFAEVGDELEYPELSAALGVWRAFRETPLAEELTLSEIGAFSTNYLATYFNELPYEVRWGRGDPCGQAHRFHVLWEKRGGALPCSEYLDLRFNNDLPCK